AEPRQNDSGPDGTRAISNIYFNNCSTAAIALTVGVRYDASSLIGSVAGVDQLRTFTVGFSASNLFTITSYDQGPDPEVNSEGSRGLIRGQEFLTLQNPREYTFTLEVGI
ncbi:hypothetical protein GGP85_002745, partial [Salinibacter ruber]|uniref:hypothetical protein n=1 Tax=Salinibacter ruber TaxID=146919 RepID=UPI002169C227